MNLTVSVAKKNELYTITPMGEIDVYTAPELKNKLLPLTKAAGNRIQVVLEHTSYLDSTGLGVFISAYKSAKEHASYLEIIHPKNRVARLFKVTGLDEILNVRFMHTDGSEN